MGQATQKQVHYAEALIMELGYDLDDYDLNSMSFGEVSTLIDEMKSERGD